MTQKEYLRLMLQDIKEMKAKLERKRVGAWR